MRITRLAKFLISLGYGAVLYFIKIILRLVGIRFNGPCVILYYHDVTDSQRNQFAHQMDVLLRKTKPLTADYKGPLQKGVNYSVVTFDDALVGLLANAFPELAARKIPSAVFVPSDYLGQKCKWMRTAEEMLEQEGKRISQRHREQLASGLVMTADQLKQLDPHLIAIGSHTASHKKLPDLSEEEIRKELIDSKNRLESILGREIKLLSFPHGQYNDLVLKLCREAKYERVFTITPTCSYKNEDEYISGRVVTEPTDWRIEFRLKLMGAYRWMPVMSSIKRRAKTFLGRK